MTHEGTTARAESIEMNNIYQQSRARKKLERQRVGENTLLRVISTDVDDTLYSSGRNVVQTVRRTFDFTLRGAVKALSKANIPLIINTGATVETFGARVAHNTLKLGAWLGLGKAADALISDYGTSISVRQSNGHMAEDTTWRKRLEQTQVKFDDQTITWGDSSAKTLIAQRLAQELDGISNEFRGSGSLSVKMKLKVSKKGESDLTTELDKIREKVEAVFTEGVRVVFSESNRGANTAEEFHGDIILIPTGAGKDNAAYHLTEQLTECLPNPIELTHIDDGSGGIFTTPTPDNITLQQQWVGEVKPLVMKKLENDNGDEREFIHTFTTYTGPQLLALLAQDAINLQAQE